MEPVFVCGGCVRESCSDRNFRNFVKGIAAHDWRGGSHSEGPIWPDLTALARSGCIWNKSHRRSICIGARMAHEAAESRYRQWTSRKFEWLPQEFP